MEQEVWTQTTSDRSFCIHKSSKTHVDPMWISACTPNLKLMWIVHTACALTAHLPDEESGYLFFAL